MLCVEKFAPVKESTVKKMSNDWINNKSTNEITERSELFQNWIKCPTEKNKFLQKPKEHGDNINRKCQTPKQL